MMVFLWQFSFERSPKPSEKQETDAWIKRLNLWGEKSSLVFFYFRFIHYRTSPLPHAQIEQLEEQSSDSDDFIGF